VAAAAEYRGIACVTVTIAESQLELSRLLLAELGGGVGRMTAQSFTPAAAVDGLL
jgi:hypothetical protein